MAMTQCSECKHEVSDTAKTCPNCGAAAPGVPAGSAIGGAITLLLFGAFIWFFFFSGSDKSESTPNQPKTSASETVSDLGIPSPEVQARVKRYITDERMWCGKVVQFYEDPFKSSVNKKVFHVFCDDGNNAQGYEITADQAGGFLTLTEI